MTGRRLLLILMLLVGLVFLAIAGFLIINSQDTAPSTANGGPQLPVDVTGISEGIEAITQGGGATESELVGVVVSLQTVPRGWPMTEAELALDDRPRSQLGPNVITDTAEVIGLYARTDIFQGETLTRDKLVRDPRQIGREDYGPSSLIPSGWLAASVPMDRLNSVAYGLEPGDTIDIMLTFAFSQVDQEFQTLLQNSATFVLETADEEGNISRTVVVLDPYGRFEQLPTGDVAHVAPSESQRPLPVAMILQNARVIQVGAWTPPAPVLTPTPMPGASAEEGAETPTPEAGVQPTPTPRPPDVVVVALPPQQQLFLKYAVENSANIDYALRGPGDGQLYNVQNVNLNYLLQQFGMIPPDGIEYVISPNIAPTPVGNFDVNPGNNQTPGDDSSNQ